MSDSRSRSGRLAAFGAGIGAFGSGLRRWITSPRLMLLGAIPAMIVSSVVLAALIVLAVNLDGIVPAVTPFADSWTEPWRSVLRIAVALALLALAVFLAVTTFTGLCLAVGDPFYERIWRRVEADLGGLPDGEEPGFWASLRGGAASGLRLFALSVVLGLVVFLLGLVPVAGGPLAFVAGVVGGGRLLAIELLDRAFVARGIDAVSARRLRAASRGSLLGFGAAVYLVFLLPLGAVIAMPAAVAGSAVLARRVLGEEPAAPR